MEQKTGISTENNDILILCNIKSKNFCSFYF